MMYNTGMGANPDDFDVKLLGKDVNLLTKDVNLLTKM